MDAKQAMETLTFYVRPQTFPVALRLCSSEGELPEKVRLPARDLGYQVALCQGIGLARRYGWTLAMGRDDQCCVGGVRTMGFLGEPGATPPDKELEPGKYTHLLVAPLHSAAFEPHIVALYVNSAQAMRLVQAAGRAPGQSAAPGQGVSAIASGFGDCGDVVARTFRTDECQVILPSGGDRIFGGTQDHEFIFTMPGSKVEGVLKGLEDTHGAGFRYPIVTDLRHRPALPPFLEIPKEA
jgi:uncharacterized protein (DUF169 family)